MLKKPIILRIACQRTNKKENKLNGTLKVTLSKVDDYDSWKYRIRLFIFQSETYFYRSRIKQQRFALFFSRECGNDMLI